MAASMRKATAPADEEDRKLRDFYDKAASGNVPPLSES